MTRPDRTEAQAFAEGAAVRREVLSDAHVDAASPTGSAFGAPMTDLLTRYAWGEIWTRPGLDRRTRSAVTLTALIALGHWDELRLHLAAARRNGLTDAAIQEVLLQTAVYCGVPAAHHAFAVAEEVLGSPASPPPAHAQTQTQTRPTPSDEEEQP